MSDLSGAAGAPDPSTEEAPLASSPVYYAAYSRIGDPILVGSCVDYLQAIWVLASRKARGLDDLGTPAVLLNLGTVPFGDETAMRRLLQSDPVLRALWKYGYDQGYDDGDTAGFNSALGGSDD